MAPVDGRWLRIGKNSDLLEMSLGSNVAADLRGDLSDTLPGQCVSKQPVLPSERTASRARHPHPSNDAEEEYGQVGRVASESASLEPPNENGRARLVQSPSSSRSSS